MIRDAATFRALRRCPATGSRGGAEPGTGLVASAPGRSVRLLDLRTASLRTARGRHAAPSPRALQPRRRPARDRRPRGAPQRVEPGAGTALEMFAACGPGVGQDHESRADGRTAYSAGHDGTVIAWDLTHTRRWERPLRRRSRTRTAGRDRAAHDATLRRDRRAWPRRRLREPHAAPHGPDPAAARARYRCGGRTGWRDPGDHDRRRRARVLGPGRAAPWRAANSQSGRQEWHGSAPTGAGSRPVATTRSCASGTRAAVPPRTACTRSRGRPQPQPRRHDHGGHPPEPELRWRPRDPLGPIPRADQDGGPADRHGRALLAGRTILVYGDRDGRVWTLDTRTWKPRGRPVDAQGSILTVDLSSDGRLLATTSTDRTGRLWDLASGRPIGATLSGGSGDPIGAAFIGRGGHLAVVHDRGGVVWDVRPQSWAPHACAVAGRPLTRRRVGGRAPTARLRAPACAPR